MNKQQIKAVKIAAYSLAGILLCGALGYYNFIYQEPKGSLEIGDTMPNFSVAKFTLSNGAFEAAEEEYVLYENENKLRVVNYWATWCGGCIAEMPYFGEFAAKYPEVQVVAISRAESRAYEDVCRWLNGNASVRAWASYPITFCYDKQDDGASKGLYYDLGFSGAMPTTFIVGADGKIKDKISYEMHSLEDVENLVLQYL